MKARLNRRRRIDSRIQARRHARVIGEIRLRRFGRHFHSDSRGKSIEQLMRPYRSGWTTFDRPRAAAQFRRQRVLRRVCLFGGCGIQRRDCIPRQNVEPRHRLRERLHAKQRTGRRAGRNPVGVHAAREGTQPIDRQQQPSCCDDAPSDQVTPRDLAGGVRLYDFAAIVPSVLGFPESCPRRFR